MKKQIIATLVLASIVVCLLWVSADILTRNRQMAFGRIASHESAKDLLGIAFTMLAVTISWLRHWLVAKIVRFTTAILIALAIMLEPVLHAFGIPHPEGLWLPLLEGGAVVTALANYWNRIKAWLDLWFRKLRNRIKNGPRSD